MIALRVFDTAVYRRGLPNKITNGDTELVIVMWIGHIDAHTGIGRPPFIEHNTGLHPDLFEGAIATIAKQPTRCAITGDEHIWPTILVEIENRWRKCPGSRGGNTRHLGHIRKCPIAAIAIESDALSLKIAYGTIVLCGLAIRAIQALLKFRRPFDVASKDQVEPTMMPAC